MAGIGYAFISAYLKGEEARMVNSDHLSALMKASGYQEAVDAIRDTDIGEYLTELDIQKFEDLDESLWIYFNGCLNRIGWFKGVPQDVRNIIRDYSVKYDILNIKTALQNILNGTEAKGIPAGGIYERGLMEEMSGAEDLDQVVSILNSCKLAEYAGIIEQYRTEDTISKDVLTDTGMEALYYANLQKSIRKVKDSASLKKVFNTMIDMTNLQIILRAVMSESKSSATGRTIEGGYLLNESVISEMLALRVADMPARMEHAEIRTVIEEVMAGYEKEQNIAAIDEIIDKHKFRLTGEILSPRIMSPVVAVWYLMQKEVEVRNIRLILKAALDDIPVEEIRDYLVYTE